MLSRIVPAQRARLRLPCRATTRTLPPPRVAPARSDAGQTTTEYALVTLGAAAVALLVTAWAGRTGKIGQLLDAVVDRVIGGM
jgi:Protein of unknown function (DUF4244)